MYVFSYLPTAYRIYLNLIYSYLSIYYEQNRSIPSTCQSTYLPTYLSTFLSRYQLESRQVKFNLDLCLHPFLFAFVSVYLPTCVSHLTSINPDVYLFPSLYPPSFLSVFLSFCPSYQSHINLV